MSTGEEILAANVNESAQKKNMVYSSIFADIVRNEYDLSSIITEKKTIEKYDVSKSPVREALLELCNDGILESIPRLGYRIKPISVKELMDATEFRLIIETEALKKSFLKITDEQIALLEANYAEGLELKDIKDTYLHWDKNSKFHTLLCSFSENQFFTDTLKLLMKTCFRGANYYYDVPDCKERSSGDSSRHRIIIDRIKARNYDGTIEILSEDIVQIKSAIHLMAGF